jgi:hypothetical protein
MDVDKAEARSILAGVKGGKAGKGGKGRK